MEFLNPAMLFLAGAAAAPVILHLIMRQAPKHIVFPALQFVRQRQDSNRRKLRLRHLILLALRMLALMFLALALARPSVTASGLAASQEAPVSAVLVIDTSPSMSYEQENKTRLQAAQDIAAWLLDEIPDESQVGVIDSRIDSNVYQVDVNAAAEFAKELQLTTVPSRFDLAIESAWKLLKTGQHDVKELYIFTDLTRAEWPSEAAARLTAMMQENPGSSVHVVDVGMTEPQNTRLSNPRLSKQSIARNQQSTLTISVEREGHATQPTVQLWLANQDGELELKGENATNFGSSDSVEVEFQLANLAAGTHQGEIRLSTRDKLSVDDSRYFTVDAKPAWPVLLAASPAAMANTEDFLWEFLAPTQWRLEDRTVLDCDIVDQRELANVNLREYAVIGLVDPRPLSEPVWERLLGYVNEGGGLAILLGREAGNGSGFNVSAAQALMPGDLAAPATFAIDDSVYLDTADARHPMLNQLHLPEFPPQWTNFWIRRAWQFNQLREDAPVVASFTNGMPAIVERIVGNGRVVVMTTPATDLVDPTNASDDQAWNSFTQDGWEPMVLLSEMFRDLAGRTDESLNFSAGPGMTAVLNLDLDVGIDRYNLSSPSGDRRFRDTDPAQSRILISSIEEIGNYRVSLKQVELDRGFSVNLSAEQTDLTRLDATSLYAFFGGEEIPIARSQDELQRNVTFAKYGQELFPWLIVIVAIVMGVEHVLANRFYGMRDTPVQTGGWRSGLAGFATGDGATETRAPSDGVSSENGAPVEAMPAGVPSASETAQT